MGGLCDGGVMPHVEERVPGDLGSRSVRRGGRVIVVAVR